MQLFWDKQLQRRSEAYLISAKLVGLNPCFYPFKIKRKKNQKKKKNSFQSDSQSSPPFMATKFAMRPLLSLAHQKAASETLVTARRTLTTYSVALHHPPAQIRQSISKYPRSFIQQQFRRSYADTRPQPYFRRSRAVLRWVWRAVYLGAIGGVGYLGYTIYLLRTPPEQLVADPSKKNLVILGDSPSIGGRNVAIDSL